MTTQLLESHSSAVSAASEALWLVTQGFHPIALEPVSKGTHEKSWNAPQRPLDSTVDDFDTLFPSGKNLGVLTGPVSHELRDIDLDCPEAVGAAADFLPPTKMIWGRRREARHYGYISPNLASAQFKDPSGRMLVEIRGDKLQTMVPPSIHPEGGTVQWVTRGPAAEMEAPHLLEAARKVAACALIAQHWPGKGSRQDFALFLSGWLLKRLDKEVVVKIVRAAARAAHDTSELDRRQDAVEQSWNKLQQSERAVRGLPHLLDLMPAFTAAVPLIERWLGINGVAACEPEPFRIRSAKEVSLHPAPVIEWYWPGWLPSRSVAVLHGPGGDRKSFLALALALSTAAGRALFEDAPAQPGTALYVSGAGENPEWEDDRRLHLLCQGYGIDMDALPFYFITADAPLLGDEHSYQRLVEIITSLHPQVVVLDSAIALSGLANENDNAEVRRFLQQRVVPLARRHACTVLLLAHSAKPSPMVGGNRIIEEPRGAGEWRNAAETVIAIRQEAGVPDTSVARLRKLRVGARLDRAIRFSVEDCHDGLRVRVEAYAAPSGDVKVSEALVKAVEEASAAMQANERLRLKDLQTHLKNSGHPERAYRAATDILRGRKAWPIGPHSGKKQAVVMEEGTENRSPVLVWTGGSAQHEPGDDKREAA